MALSLTYAGGLYDRTLALKTGEIQPEGMCLEYLTLPVEDVFWRMMRYQEYDLSEMSLASYAIAHERGEPDLIAIPVFPSRHFRLSCIYVRPDSPLRSLGELRGKRVGVPEYQMTAAVWLRGMLAEHYSVPVESVQWITGRPERLPIVLPETVSVKPHAGPGNLADALRAGEIDALMAARLPEDFAHGTGMRRLLPDSRMAEVEYYKKTGLFPIMHTVAIQGGLYRQHPWIARSLYEAFCRAKQQAIDLMYETTSLRCALPWLVEELEETRRLLGNDFWPYGLDSNWGTLDTLLRYLFEQGLTRTRLQPEALFAKNVLEP